MERKLLADLTAKLSYEPPCCQPIALNHPLSLLVTMSTDIEDGLDEGDNDIFTVVS